MYVQKTQAIESMMSKWWASIADGGPTIYRPSLDQYLVFAKLTHHTYSNTKHHSVDSLEHRLWGNQVIQDFNLKSEHN